MGMTYVVGEQKVLPGVYVRDLNVGGLPPAGAGTEAVACAFQATSGPLDQVLDVTTLGQIDDFYGQGAGTDAPREALRGGASLVRALRVGSGGAAASLLLLDTTAGTAVEAVTLTAASPGSRQLAVVLRDSLADPTRRELLVLERSAGDVLTQRAVIAFAKGATGVGEPQALVDAVTASGNPFVTAALEDDGNKLLASLGTATDLTGGTDPAADAGAYADALERLAGADDWSVLAFDSDDGAIQAAAAEYIAARRNNGARVRVFVAQPSTEDLADRLTAARAYNASYVSFFGNGFVGLDGLVRDGWRVACRAAGQVCSTPVTQALTGLPLAGAVSVVGALSEQDRIRAATAGMNVIIRNTARQVVYEQGLTTFITPTQTLDAGWGKLRRARERDMLVTRIVRTWDPIKGQISNTPRGRNVLVAAGNGICEDMIREEAFLYARVYEDPGRPPAGDYAYFICEALDVDSLEKIYIDFWWSYAGAVAQAA